MNYLFILLLLIFQSIVFGLNNPFVFPVPKSLKFNRQNKNIR